MGHEGVPPGHSEQDPEYQAYLKRVTLGTLGSLATQSGKPIEAVLAEAVKAYKRKYGESEGQRSVTGIAEIEAYQSIVVGKSREEGLDVLGSILEPATWEVLGEGVNELSWDRVDAYYRNLKADPKAWKQEQDERAVWEAIALQSLSKP